MLSQRYITLGTLRDDNNEGLILATSGGNLDYLKQHFNRMSSTQNNLLTDKLTTTSALLIVAIGAKQQNCAKFLLDYGKY